MNIIDQIQKLEVKRRDHGFAGSKFYGGLLVSHQINLDSRICEQLGYANAQVIAESKIRREVHGMIFDETLLRIDVIRSKLDDLIANSSVDTPHDLIELRINLRELLDSLLLPPSLSPAVNPSAAAGPAPVSDVLH